MPEEPIDPEEANNAREESEETKTAEEQSEQRARNDTNYNSETETKQEINQDATKAFKDYQKKLGKLFGGTENGPVSPEEAINCVNILDDSDVSTFNATFQPGFFSSATTLDLTNVKSITDKNLNELINKFTNGTKPKVDLLRQVLTDMETPGERAIFLSELFDTRIKFDMTKMSDGSMISVTSRELNATLPYVRRLFEGKGAENLKNFKVNGVDYTISDSEGVKKGDDQLLTPDQLNDLKQNLENYNRLREQYEEALKKKNLEDILNAKQRELAMRKRIDKLLDALPGILKIILVLAAGFEILHLLLKGGKDEANHNSGCYLITNQTYLTDPSSKCYSNTFKIDVDDEDGKYNCDDPGQCCNNADFNFGVDQPNFNFKNNEGAPSYWYVLDETASCTGTSGGEPKYTLPAYRGKSNLCQLNDHLPDKNQALSAEAKDVLRQANPNVNFGGGLPANFWNTKGSVTYGIRKLSTAEGVANLACQTDNIIKNFSKTIGKTILYIGGAIVLLFVIFYFVKFEYDKHDGKVKAKYRK